MLQIFNKMYDMIFILLVTAAFAWVANAVGQTPT